MRYISKTLLLISEHTKAFEGQINNLNVYTLFFKGRTTFHGFFSIGNSIVSSAITDEHARVSFLKTAKNSASPKDERYLHSLKNSRVHVFP